MIDDDRHDDRQDGRQRSGEHDSHAHHNWLCKAERVTARVRWPRWKRRYGILAAGLFILLAIVAVAAVLRFSAGPVALDGVAARVTAALAERLGPGWSATIRDSHIVWGGAGPAIEVQELQVISPDGRPMLEAGRAVIDMDPVSLALGRFIPRSIDLDRLKLHLAMAPDGSLGLGAGTPFGATAIGDGVSAGAAAAASLVQFISGRSGPLGDIDRATLKDANIVIVDQAGRERPVFRDMNGIFRRTGAGRLHMAVDVRGRTGMWNVTGEVGDAPSGREATLVYRDVSLADLLLVAGQSNAAVAVDTDLSGQATLVIAPDGSLAGFKASADASEGEIRFADPALPRIGLEDAALDIGWDAQARRFLVNSARIAAGGVQMGLAGHVTPASGKDPWRLNLTGQNGQLTGVTPADAAVPVDTIRIDAAMPADGGSVEAQVALTSAGGDARASASATDTAQGLAVKVEIGGRIIDTRTALRLWPNFLSHPSRDFLIESLKGGLANDLTIRIDLPPDQMKLALANQAWADEALHVSFDISNARFVPVPGIPPLVSGSATGLISGRTARVDVKQADVAMEDGRRLGFRDGLFLVADTAAKNPLARVDFKLAGGADALASMLAAPALRESVTIPLDPAGLRGTADIEVGFSFALDDNVRPGSIPIAAEGRLKDLHVDRILGPEGLDNGQLTVSFANKALVLKGTGNVMGLPATINVAPGQQGAGEATISFLLDEAARAKKGISLGSQLSGVIGIKASLPLDAKADRRPRVELDLTRAAIDELVPGWTKPAGRPGKASFIVNETGKATSLEDFVLDSAGLSARGIVELRPDMSLAGAVLEAVKLSPGDDMKVVVERSAAGLTKINIKGNVIDTRPLLKAATSAPTAPRARTRNAKPAEKGDFDLELTSPILTGHNNEAITNGDLRLSQRDGQIRQLKMTGRIGSRPVNVDLVTSAGQPAVLVVDTGDGGGFLRFIDLYRRMVGGDLVLRMTPFEARQAGELTVRDFVLKDEPALRRIIAQQPTGAAGNDRASALPVPIDGNEVQFTKFRADFARNAARLDIREAVIWGPQVGLNINGNIDYARDRADLMGTFVPAYGLNNAFSQVPIFGLFLGGGQYEGLFAVNFRISGAASAPTLTINPLSAIAPGIFRKFFEAFRAEDITSSPGQVPPVPTR